MSDATTDAYREMRGRKKLKELFKDIKENIFKILVDVHEDGEHVTTVKIDRDGVIYFGDSTSHKGHIEMFPDARYTFIKEVE